MNARLRGIIGGFSGGGAPRPSGAGSTRQPEGCGFVGGLRSAGESAAKLQLYSGTIVRPVAQTSGEGLREERLVFGGITIVLRVSAEDSGGAMTVLEEVEPMSDTPLHVHSNEDELFYIVEGEHIITLGDEEHRLGPGAAIFAPRGIPHAQRRVEPGIGRELVVLNPGG